MSKENKHIPYKNSRFDDSIVDAMLVSNIINKKNGSKEKFTFADATIMSIVHSYFYSDTRCFASNNYFAGRALTTEPTIQKSINKLCGLGFISRKSSYKDGIRHRVLVYNEDVVEKFKSEMNDVLFDYDDEENHDC